MGKITYGDFMDREDVLGAYDEHGGIFCWSCVRDNWGDFKSTLTEHSIITQDTLDNDDDTAYVCDGCGENLENP